MSEQHGDITPAVRSAVEAAGLLPQDAGARALAERYAALLDEVAPTRDIARAARIVGNFIARATGDLTEQQEREVLTAWDKLSSALAEHSVASDLGPKLLAVLIALGCTVSARGEKGGGGKIIPLPNPLQQARDAARDLREQRSSS